MDANVQFQIGAFFMINLCLVVIATQFAETKKRETEKMIEERLYQRSSNSSSSLDASEGEPIGCYLQVKIELKLTTRLIFIDVRIFISKKKFTLNSNDSSFAASLTSSAKHTESHGTFFGYQ